MLKTLFVSSVSLLKSKRRRYYWVPPEKDKIRKNSLINQKYDIPAELFESQEKELKNINEQLTKQIIVIEKIDNYTIDTYNYIDKIDTLQKVTLYFIWLTYVYSKH